MAHDSVANLLLRITGDADDAKHDVEEVLGFLKDLDHAKAEAEANVDTGGADTELGVLLALLKEVDGKRVSADADVQTTGATAHLAAFQLLLTSLDSQTVNVDVDVETGGAEAHLALFGAKILAFKALMGGLPGEMGQVGSAAGGMGGKIGGAGTAAGGAGKSFSLFGLELGQLGLIALGLLPIVFSLGAALVALATSLAGALAAAGALALGLGAGLIPVFGLVAVAMAALSGKLYKNSAAIQKMHDELKKLGQGITAAFKPGVLAFLNGMASALRTITPLFAKLKDPIRLLGQVMGDSLRQIAQELAGPLAGQLQKLISNSAQLVAAMTPGITALIGIFLKLANQALPFVIQGVKALSGWLGKIDGSKISAFLAAVMPMLSAWMNLIGAISSLFLAFFKAIAPLAQNFTNWLAKGVDKLALWLKSAKGQKEMRQFFKDMLDLAKQLVPAIGKLVVIIAQIAQVLAPAFTMILKVLNPVLSVAMKVIGFLRPILQVLMKLAAIASMPFVAIFVVAVEVVKHFHAIVTAVWNAIKTGAGAVATAVKAVVGAFVSVITFITSLPGKIIALLGKLPAGIKDLFKKMGLGMVAAIAGVPLLIAGLFVGLAGKIIGKIGDIGGSIAHHIADGFNAAKDFVTGIFGDGGKESARHFKQGMASIKSGVEDGAKALAESADRGLKGGGDHRGVGKAVGEAFKRGIQGTKGSVGSTGSSLGRSVAAAMHGTTGQSRSAGTTLGNAAAQGIGGAIGQVMEAARNSGHAGAAAVQESQGEFHSGGESLMQMFADGISAGVSWVVSAVRSAVQAARDQLPGSEPKDRRSPLYGLKHSGIAMIGNFAEGIRKGAPGLAQATDYAIQYVKDTIDSDLNSGKVPGFMHAEGLDLQRYILPALENLRGFISEVVQLSDNLDALVPNALEAWAARRQQRALAALDRSPLARKLAALTQQDEQATQQTQVRDIRQTISDAKQKLDDLNKEAASPFRTRSLADIEADRVALRRQIQDAQDQITSIYRQAQIQRLTDAKTAKTDEINTAYDMERQGMTRIASQWAIHFRDRLEHLRKMLGAGEISYAQFVKRVRGILQPLGLAFQFDISAESEQWLAAGKKIMHSLAEGIKKAGPDAVDILRVALNYMKNLLPHSEPKDRGSPLYGLQAAGEAMLKTMSLGFPRGADYLAAQFNAELAGVNIMGGDMKMPVPTVVKERSMTVNPHFPPAPGRDTWPDEDYIGNQFMDYLRKNGGF